MARDGERRACIGVAVRGCGPRELRRRVERELWIRAQRESGPGAQHRALPAIETEVLELADRLAGARRIASGESPAHERVDPDLRAASDARIGIPQRAEERARVLAVRAIAEVASVRGEERREGRVHGSDAFRQQAPSPRPVREEQRRLHPPGFVEDIEQRVEARQGLVPIEAREEAERAGAQARIGIGERATGEGVDALGQRSRSEVVSCEEREELAPRPGVGIAQSGDRGRDAARGTGCEDEMGPATPAEEAPVRFSGQVGESREGRVRARSGRRRRRSRDERAAPAWLPRRRPDPGPAAAARNRRERQRKRGARSRGMSAPAEPRGPQHGQRPRARD